MEHDRFYLPYLSDKIPEDAFHGQSVRTVAYLRVSTAQQDLRSQRLALLEYARKHDFRIDDFIEATASGQASEKRRRLDELMNVLQRGDRLVVSELSRLGRSLGQIVAISLKKENPSAKSPGPSMSMSQQSIAAYTTRRPYDSTPFRSHARFNC